ncbi:MAG TPA: DUF2726 domain-containing protein [Steroidobacteraceae bacterium]|jgi:hypothetical protein|nr:DUF2726 domain-containing protein [Steroidobacteraceae bacterium]
MQKGTWTAWGFLVFAALVCVALLCGAFVLAARRHRRLRLSDRISGPWPLQVRRELLTERELALYHRLVHSLPEHIVLAQVHLLQVLEFWPGGRTQALFNRISQLSIDFLVLNADTSIVAAIELDDGRPSRPWADARKTHALKSAGVPLIRWSASHTADTAAIRAAILDSQAQGP